MDVCEDARAANERSARTSFPGDSVRLRISRSRRQGPALRLSSVNFLGEFRSYDVCVVARRGRPGIVSCGPSPKSQVGWRIMSVGIRIDDTDADLQSRFAASYPVPHVTGFFPFDSSLYPLPQFGNSSRPVRPRGRLPAGCPPLRSYFQASHSLNSNMTMGQQNKTFILRAGPPRQTCPSAPPQSTA